MCEYDTFGCCSDTLVLQYSLQASIAELASTAATDVGMSWLSNEETYYWSTMYINKGVTQNGNTID